MRTPSRALAIGIALAMLVAACGDDDDEVSGDTSTTATDDTTDDPTDDPTDDTADEGQDDPSTLEVTVTMDGVELSSDSIPGGVVEVTFVNDTGSETDVDFTQVVDGTTEAEFAEGFLPVFEGGAFPDFAITEAGFGADADETVTSTIVLGAGEYIVWSTPTGPEEEAGGGEPSTEDFVTATLTVTEPENEAAFPETDGTITAKDYGFDLDVTGPGTYTFSNTGPMQFHHAVIVDFGTNDAELIREKFPEILQGDEDSPPPEGIDTDQVDFDFASSGVFGPEGMGTFDADFESGNTYAVVCFISDRTGGEPHAIAYDMWEVFQAG